MRRRRSQVCQSASQQYLQRKSHALLLDTSSSTIEITKFYLIVVLISLLLLRPTSVDVYTMTYIFMASGRLYIRLLCGRDRGF